MALRRMFSLTVIDTDRFLEMPSSARLLYYDLGMRADDDGFVASPKKVMKMTGAAMDDLKLLVTKNYIIPFESGVCVITDWKQNNYIRADRYTETTNPAVYLLSVPTLWLDDVEVVLASAGFNVWVACVFLLFSFVM